MGNISKKIRKKLIKVIEANCHRVTHFGEQDAMFVPYAAAPSLFFLNYPQLLYHNWLSKFL